MSVSDVDIAFARDVSAGLGPLTSRKMKGGLYLYRDGVLFVLLYADGTLWLKGAGARALRMQSEGWPRWTYTRPGGKLIAMPYWRLPEPALDDPDLAANLARAALDCL